MILDNLKLIKQGKVREIYDLGDSFLFVASDRISAFDVVIEQPIQGKGKILNKISQFWFEKTSDIVKNHVLEADFEKFPADLKKIDYLKDRSMIVKKAEVLPVECIVRGYLVGSGYKEYSKSGTVCGIKLPENLKLASKLPEPIFTPSTKADEGHDENISFDKMVNIIGKEAAEKLRDYSLALYKYASNFADEKGIIIADTKFEFGVIDGEIVVIDEMLTPDSSRFWPKSSYTVGKNPPSFDKQFVRDYLESCDWDKTPPAPPLPDEIVNKTVEKYLEAYAKLTGKNFKL